MFFNFKHMLLILHMHTLFFDFLSRIVSRKYNEKYWYNQLAI